MNLKNEQRRYKVFLDDSYALEKEPGKTEEIWRYYELRGKYGTLYAYSPSLLGCLVTSPTIANRVRREKNWNVRQAGDDETLFIVPDNEFQDAVDIIAARKRRFGNPANASRLAQFQFKPGFVNPTAQKEAQS